VKEEKPKQVFDKKHVIVGLSNGISIEIKKGLTVDDKIRGTEISKKGLKTKPNK
jgi:HlyD family secretion protein